MKTVKSVFAKNDETAIKSKHINTLGLLTVPM